MNACNTDAAHRRTQTLSWAASSQGAFSIGFAVPLRRLPFPDARWIEARWIKIGHQPRPASHGEFSMDRPSYPPYTAETAAHEVRMAEDAWNTRNATRVDLAHTTDSRWRNRAEILRGHTAIRAFPASINDLPITDRERQFHWSLGRRPDEHATLSELCR